LIDRRNQRFDTALLAQQRGSVASQGFQSVVRRIVERSPDVGERESEFTVEEDFREPYEVGLMISPVPGRRAAVGTEQSDLVVVMEGPHRDSRHSGHFGNRVTADRVVVVRVQDTRLNPDVA